eukprot:m.21381 g.21381  ORF g.21381 m.21381 type:complete len:500 (+) comp3920_c0_seq1:16-1515(+)
MQWCAAILVASLAAAACAQYSVHDSRIFDAEGRECLFHGVNVVYKSAPYVPLTDHFDPIRSFAEEDAQLLNGLGLNVIRLGSQWPGVEPERGQYNATYVAELRKIVDLCARYNITVFLDAHQDCFSERFCGEGVPLWVAKEHTNFPEPLEGLKKFEPGPRGVPTLEQCAQRPWSSYQFTFAGADGYESLYLNENGYADAFGKFWQHLATQFRGARNILAFELLNEPFCGAYYKHPELLFPGHSDKVRLTPFYDRVGPMLREGDPDRLIMFEPTTWSDEFGWKMMETGLEHAPGGPKFGNKSIFSYHFYTNVNLGNHDEYLLARQRDLKRFNSAGFVTETEPNLLDDIERHLQSWAVWEYKSFLPTMNQTDLIPVCTGCGSLLWPNGKYSADMGKQLSRTYPQATQGLLVSSHFDETSNAFKMVFTANLDVKAPTRIFLNEQLRYPHGHDVSFDYDSASVHVEQSPARPNFVEFLVQPASASGSAARNTTVTVTLIAKSA